ncbi:MAG: phospho-N-acetylmuramoyl-pentapeptide-transferase [Candidatus Margulisiibacteriota bacterium]|jgi:phospho-N-acetylmuramoyl-pentapeptide-transferase
MIKLLFLLIVALAINNLLLYVLSQFKIYQKIYVLSPELHQQKQKTPSFGGLAILFTFMAGILIFKLFSLISLWLFLLFLCFSLIGFYDDLLSILKKNNKGLSARQKFFLQIITSFIFLILYSFLIQPLGIIWFVFYLFIFVGASNATNLTDGLDGLLTGLAILSALGFATIFYKTGNIELVRISLVFIISLLGFLSVNKHKAKIFMGDTGSLAIGGLLAGFSLALNNPWVLIPLGLVYILETVSVILQVCSYKIFKRRIFKMAPLHHHFELMGLSEIKVVFLFWLIGLSGLLISFLFL